MESENLTQQTYASMAACAAATGFTKGCLKAAKSLNAPGFTLGGRVNWAELKPWLDSHAEQLQSETEENSKDFWSLQKLKFDAKRSELAYETDKGNLLSKEEVSAQVTSLASATKSVLRTRLEEELPAKLVGLDAISIKKVMADTVDSICEVFTKGFESWN